MSQFDLRLEAVGKSDRGVKRTNNEDAFAIHLPTTDRPDALFMVADGIGGLSKGEVASRMTLETILKHYFTVSPDSDTSGKLDPGAHLLGALQVANQAVLAKAMEDMDRMGSTVAGLLIDYRRQATIFNVGDSRVYRIRNNAIAQLSQDQVLDIPVAPSEKGGTHKRTSKLLFFIGQNRPLEPYFERFTVQPGDSFVLCSDGLWSLVKSQEILELVSSQSAQNAAERLIELARQRGAPDNVTVVIIHTRELRNNSLLPLAIAGTTVVAIAAVGFVFFQSRNAAPAANLVQTEAASTLVMANALTETAFVSPTPTVTETSTPIPPTATPTITDTPSQTFTPTANITATLEAAKLSIAASETSAAVITGTAAAQATASANAQAATDAVSTISAAAIATSGAQATGTVQIKTVEAQIETRVAGTQTALASLTPSATPTSTTTASYTPSQTPTASDTPTITPSVTPSPSLTNTLTLTEAPTQPDTSTPSASPSGTPTTPSTASPTSTATTTPSRQPAGLGTAMSRSGTNPANTVQPTQSATATPTRTPEIFLTGSTVQPSHDGTLIASGLPETVTLPDGTKLVVDLDITYQLFSGMRKVYKGPGSRYGIVTEIASGTYKYPVLARLQGSFYWYLILLPDQQTAWIAVPSGDNFAKITTAGEKSLTGLIQLPEPAIPTVTNTPTTAK